MRTTSRGRPGRLGLAAAALAIALLGSSCTGDGKDTPEGETSSSPSEPPPLARREHVRIGVVAGPVEQAAQRAAMLRGRHQIHVAHRGATEALHECRVADAEVDGRAARHAQDEILGLSLRDQAQGFGGDLIGVDAHPEVNV